VLQTRRAGGACLPPKSLFLEKAGRISLSVWRGIVVLGVALSLSVAIWEFFLPRVDWVDGTLAPIGTWFALPGRPTASYRVVREAPQSDLAAAGIVVGDILIPPDSFRSRWLFGPDWRVPVTVIHNGGARQTTLVASSRHLPITPLDWTIRISRIVLKLSMLALALIVAWQLPDALWVRWMCAFLLLISFAPWQLDPLKLSGTLRLAVTIAQDVTVQAGITAAVVFAALVPNPVDTRLRTWALRMAPVAFVVMTASVLGMLFDLRPIYVGVPLRSIQIACFGATIAFLILAANRATDQERQRLRYLAWTFALGFSGFFISVFGLWATKQEWGTNYQLWSLPRLTMIVLLIGFAYGLLAHRVVSTNYIAGRTLLYGALTSLLVPLFTAAEWTATNLFSSTQGKSAFLVALTAVIAASFKGIHKRAEQLFNELLFRGHYEAEKAVKKLTKEVSHIEEAPEIAKRCVTLLREHLGVAAAALYVHAEPETGDTGAGADYLQVAATGDSVPASVADTDPVVSALRAEREAVEYTVLGKGGYAFPMTIRDHLIGFLLAGPRRDGEIFTPDEIKQLTGLTNAVAAALEAIRVEDLEHRLVAAEAGRDELKRLLSDLVAPGARAS
jgi:hypothetical protein